MTKTKSFYAITLTASMVLLITVIVLMSLKQWQVAGPLTIAFFVLLALGFRGYAVLQGFVFSAVIFACVAIALFYPQYFQQVYGYRLTVLIVPLIQLIMFGMGTGMSIHDFAMVFQSPRGVLIGISAQLLIMPIIGYVLASVSGLSPEIAAGIVLMGCSPSGVASNVRGPTWRCRLRSPPCLRYWLRSPPRC